MPTLAEILRTLQGNGPRPPMPPAPVMTMAPSNPKPKGLIVPGNIDLMKRPITHNPDGSSSTVRSMSFDNGDGREILVPTVSDDGRIVSDEEAMDTYRRTGKHLGIFDSPQNATDYGYGVLHKDYESGTIPGYPAAKGRR